jgi:hypothetical protein
VLLSLLAFNWYGYRLYIELLEQQASTSLQQKLDLDQYDNNSLIEVKVPVSLPYLSSWTSFEKYQGETEINGVHYKYVKRKLVNDTLVLLCIPNETKNELRTARSDYFKQVNDLQTTSKKTNSGKDQSVKIPISDYLIKDCGQTMPPSSNDVQHHSSYFDPISFLFRMVAEQPPDC